ncbi:Phosphotransferase enzyme [Onygenales sp. PD_12]|nr:Phosphotransferase enzyme [Onygenales sp. PD_12]
MRLLRLSPKRIARFSKFGISRPGVLICSPGPKSNNINLPYDEFYKYTGGRWLWDEEKQFKARYKEFDVPALQEAAARAVGATQCQHISKVIDGQYNKVFRLVMDNGAVVIANLPYLISGCPPYYSTASTAATMEFARTILGVPIPKVLAYDADGRNPVGSEYILTDEANGTRLNEAWRNMDARDEATVIKDLVSIHKKLLSVSFARYGSLYFSSDSIKGAVPAEIKGLVSLEVQKHVRDKFVIGPTTGRDFWYKQRAGMDLDRGPWCTPEEYSLAVGRREISWMNEYPNQREIDTDEDGPPTDEDQLPKAHISLLDMFMRIAPQLMPNDPELVASTLWHPNLHGENVFLENNHISSIVGWQHAWAGPLFTEAIPPALVDVKGDTILEYPDNFQSLAEDERIDVEKRMKDSVLRYAYEDFIGKEVPRLHKLFSFEFQAERTYPIKLCGGSWDEDAVCRFRESLMKLQRRWDFLGIDGAIPYTFSDEELSKQASKAEKFNSHEDFMDMLSVVVSRDGWTSNETYQRAINGFAEMATEVLEADQDIDERVRVQFQQWIDRAAEANKGE